MPPHIIVGTGGRESIVERRGRRIQLSKRGTGSEPVEWAGGAVPSQREQLDLPVLSWRNWTGWCGRSCVKLCSEHFCM